ASCTCPRGGFCKHIVALLLAYIHEPETFREVPPLEALLAALTREDLEALIANMVQREPSLLALVERAVALPSGSSVDAATLRREVGRALRHENPDDIEADLRDLLKRAESLAEKGDWRGAGLVYQEVLAGLAASYGDELPAMDEEGVVAAVAADCIYGLSECLDEFEDDCAARRAWLTALLEAELADIALGGVDFAPGAFAVLLHRATEEEWLVVEERVRELIPQSQGWKRERLVEILVSWREKHGRHQEARRILREMGTTKQRLFLLVREGKPDEAAVLARE
ncbi:MAG: SWIM zinc finger family protein, partial [Clostridia bacterium]|nr:SWIM zinc finger family protein [Clostridia bacterium]